MAIKSALGKKADQPLVAAERKHSSAASFPLTGGDRGTLAASQVAGRSSGHDPHATHDANPEFNSEKTMFNNNTGNGSEVNLENQPPAERATFSPFQMDSRLTRRIHIDITIVASVTFDMTAIQDFQFITASASTQPWRVHNGLLDGI